MPGSRKSVAEAAIQAQPVVEQYTLQTLPEECHTQNDVSAIALLDLSKEKMQDLKVPRRVDAIASYILMNAKKTDERNTMSSQEIVDQYNKLKEENPDAQIIEIPQNSIVTNLSIIAQESWSKINCQGRRQGYYVSLMTPGVQEAEEEIQKEEESSVLQKKNLSLEKLLYPIVGQWLANKVDRLDDISSSKKCAKWRNPDLLGVKFINVIGSEYHELYTVEVKPSMADWQQWIFEAVSHSLFAHHAYFAFLHQAEDKIPEEMREYAYKFGIGIISIEISKEDWDKFTKGGEMFTEFHISEDVIAPLHSPNLNMEIDLLTAHNIHNSTDLHNFGKDADDFAAY